jgi:hypothetical protein
MNYFLIAGAVITALTLLFDRKAMKLNSNSLSKFISIMVAITLIRWSVMSFSGVNANEITLSIPMHWFLFVLWEDAVFSLPIYWLKDKFKVSRYIWVPLVISSSVYFAIGHLYQGQSGWITIILPYFAGYKLGKKYGFGTTMACHVLYDIFTFLCVKLAPIVLI